MIKIYPQNIKNQHISFYSDNISTQKNNPSTTVAKPPVTPKDTFYKKHKKTINVISSAIVFAAVLGAASNFIERRILTDKFDYLAKKILKKKTPEKFEKALNKSLGKYNSDNEKFKIYTALTEFSSSKFYRKNDEFYKKFFTKLFDIDSSSEENLKKITNLTDNIIGNTTFLDSDISNHILNNIINAQEKVPDKLKVNIFYSFNEHWGKNTTENVIKIYKKLNDVKENNYKKYTSPWGYKENININIKELKKDLLERLFWGKNPEEVKESAKIIFESKHIEDTDKLSLISNIALQNNIFRLYDKKNNNQIELAKMLLKYVFENKADSFESALNFLDNTKFSQGNNIFGFLVKNKALSNIEKLSSIKKLKDIGVNTYNKDFDFSFYMPKLNLEEIKTKSDIFEEKYNNQASTKEFEDYADDMLKSFKEALSFSNFGENFENLKFKFKKFQDSANNNKNFNNKTSNIYDKINQFYKDNFELNNNDYKKNWNSNSYYNDNYNYDFNINKNSDIDKAKKSLLKYLKQNPEMTEIAKSFEQSNITEKNVKKVQRTLVIKYHPDKASDDKKMAYTRITQEINQNIEILKKSLANNI